MKALGTRLGNACFLPAFFPYKVQFPNNHNIHRVLPHKDTVTTFTPMAINILKYTIEVYIIEVYTPPHELKSRLDIYDTNIIKK
jgi:hypothetical protein